MEAWVSVMELRRLSKFPELPFKVRVPAIVTVVLAGKVRVAALETVFVKLLKVMAPERV